MTGPAHSRIAHCLKPTRPQAGFDQDMAKFEEVADAPTQDKGAGEDPEAEPPQEDGRLLIIWNQKWTLGHRLWMRGDIMTSRHV
eukprot:5835646-Pyramimonas_sp.AAC.1